MVGYTESRRADKDAGQDIASRVALAAGSCNVAAGSGTESMSKPLDDDPHAAGRQRATWMAAAQGGDVAAYRALLTDVAPMLESFVRRRLRHPEDCRDVVQDTLTLMHRARHTWDATRPFDPWLFAIARHALIDHLRRQQRRQAHEVSLDPLPEPAAEADHDDGYRRLDEALAQLPPSQREAFEMLKLQGLTVDRAAAQAGITPGALRVRAHRAYQAIRAMLGVSS